MDVDCSSITYDTKPSTIVLEAANKTLNKIQEAHVNVKEVTSVDLDSTNSSAPFSVSPDQALTNSLLSSIDVNKTTAAELKEAYCRDVDSFSWEFGGLEQQNPGLGSGETDMAKIVVCIFVGFIFLYTVFKILEKQQEGSPGQVEM